VKLGSEDVEIHNNFKLYL
jgi:dynein heavy chain, axonemal